MNENNHINYIEFPLVKNKETKEFYSKLFGWEFTDWGDSYISFSGAGIDGGFNGVDNAKPCKPGTLVVLYSSDINKIFEDVKNTGAQIVKEIYEFPGGRRFHFLDPNGNELAIWS